MGKTNNQKMSPTGYIITQEPFNVNPFFDMNDSGGGVVPDGLVDRVDNLETAVDDLKTTTGKLDSDINDMRDSLDSVSNTAAEAKTTASDANDTAISALNSVETKQDKLIAGANITIVENVISATGGGGGGSVVVDSELNKQSTNPVQNKVITSKLEQVVSTIEGQKNMIDTNTSNIQKLENNMNDYVLESVYNEDVKDLENKIPVNYIGIGSKTDNGVNDKTDIEFSMYTDGDDKKTLRANLKTSDTPTSGCTHPITSDAVYQMNNGIQMNKQNRLVSPQGTLSITAQSATRTAIDVNPYVIPEYTQGDGISISDENVISVNSDSIPTYGSSLPITSDGVYNALEGKQDKLSAGEGIVINDGVISSTGGGGGGVTVDDELSTDSTNPVQNKVITADLDRLDNDQSNLQTFAETRQPQIQFNTSGYFFTPVTQDSAGRTTSVRMTVPVDTIHTDRTVNTSVETSNTTSITWYTRTLNGILYRAPQLAVSSVPTEKCQYPITSDGVYKALQNVSANDYSNLSVGAINVDNSGTSVAMRKSTVGDNTLLTLQVSDTPTLNNHLPITSEGVYNALSDGVNYRDSHSINLTTGNSGLARIHINTTAPSAGKCLEMYFNIGGGVAGTIVLHKAKKDRCASGMTALMCDSSGNYTNSPQAMYTAACNILSDQSLTIMINGPANVNVNIQWFVYDY